ncbi:hypothetical protein T439DRAFT_148862 [Meredithblackwellia eburnea MCA 4105]
MKKDEYSEKRSLVKKTMRYHKIVSPHHFYEDEHSAEEASQRPRLEPPPDFERRHERQFQTYMKDYTAWHKRHRWHDGPPVKPKAPERSERPHDSSNLHEKQHHGDEVHAHGNHHETRDETSSRRRSNEEYDEKRGRKDEGERGSRHDHNEKQGE